MKSVKQFRYYGVNDENNYPDYPNYYGMLKSSNIFKDCGVISQIGIQGKPGTKFYFNGSSNSIILGDTGIFELDLKGKGFISAIRFDGASLDRYEDSDRLLIDIVYER